MSGPEYNAAATKRLWSLVMNSGNHAVRGEDLPAIIKALEDGADARANPYPSRPSIISNNHDLLYHLVAYKRMGHEQELLHAMALAVEQGADVHACRVDYIDSNTYLHRAAREGRSRRVQLLLEKGADKNAVNEHGETPLYVYAKDPPKELAIAQARCILTLLRAGADVSVRNKKGEYAPEVWDSAVHSYMLHMPEFRQEYGRELLIFSPYALEHSGTSNWRWKVYFDPSAVKRDAKPARPEESTTVQYMRGAIPPLQK